jgi:cytoskeletal protein CcmA (bactofilin family)
VRDENHGDLDKADDTSEGADSCMCNFSIDHTMVSFPLAGIVVGSHVKKRDGLTGRIVGSCTSDIRRSVLCSQWHRNCSTMSNVFGFGNIFRYAVTVGSDAMTPGRDRLLQSQHSIRKKGLTVSQPGKQSSGSDGSADRNGHASVVIGKGMIIKGRIHSEEDVFLNGEMEGDLDIENYRLTIGPDGKVAANARAREVDISGTLTGNVESTEKTCIRASGRLIGDVKTRGIVIEEGALFKGKVEIISKPEPAPEATSHE